MLHRIIIVLFTHPLKWEWEFKKLKGEEEHQQK
jgi:hypothetical protein